MMKMTKMRWAVNSVQCTVFEKGFTILFWGSLHANSSLSTFVETCSYIKECIYIMSKHIQCFIDITFLTNGINDCLFAVRSMESSRIKESKTWQGWKRTVSDDFLSSITIPPPPHTPPPHPHTRDTGHCRKLDFTG